MLKDTSYSASKNGHPESHRLMNMDLSVYTSAALNISASKPRVPPFLFASFRAMPFILVG